MALSGATATKELMRIAINGENYVDSLVGYYREQIDKFNDERAEWAINYEQCKESITNSEIITREIVNAEGRLHDLEMGLSVLKAELTNERQRYYRQLEEQASIKTKLEDNRSRLREMMSVCRPISVNPGKMSRSANKASLEDSLDSKSNINSRARIIPNLQESVSAVQPSQRSRRTALELELINMSKEHEQGKLELQGNIDRLKGELDELVSEHTLRGQECSREYKSALEELEKSESKLIDLTIEYFKLDLENYEAERKLQEENEVIRLKNLSIAEKLKMLKDSHTNEFKLVENEVKQKNKNFQIKCKLFHKIDDDELRKKEEHLTLLKEQNERINDIYLNKMKHLELQLRETMSKYETVEERCKVEGDSLRSQIRMEGFFEVD